MACRVRPHPKTTKKRCKAKRSSASSARCCMHSSVIDVWGAKVWLFRCPKMRCSQSTQKRIKKPAPDWNSQNHFNTMTLINKKRLWFFNLISTCIIHLESHLWIACVHATNCHLCMNLQYICGIACYKVVRSKPPTSSGAPQLGLLMCRKPSTLQKFAHKRGSMRYGPSLIHTARKGSKETKGK